MKVSRKIIEIDQNLCDGCGKCATACAENAIRIIDGKARLVSDQYCEGLGACIGECPAGALKVIEREAEPFDEQAVHADVRQAAPSGTGCPSMQVHRFEVAARPGARSESALTHWPVQIRLAPPTAPFLQGADLLIAADCVPVSYPTFHQDFLDGKVVLVGCPKFDDAELYIERFTEIFRQADVRSVTVVVMQVPCCQGLPMMVEAGMKRAGKKVPMEKVVITLNGAISKREAFVA